MIIWYINIYHIILTWQWRIAFTHLQLKRMASNKELTSSKGKVASVPQSHQQATLVEHAHDVFDIFPTATRNDSPLGTSEQKHHPSFASALVSQECWPYFMTRVDLTGLHKPCTYTQLMLRCLCYRCNSLPELGTLCLLWTSLNFPVSTSVLWQKPEIDRPCRLLGWFEGLLFWN